MTLLKSNSSRISAEPGYILHIRPYRESSVLLEVFTPHHGRVSLVGRGLRGAPTKKQRPPELFVCYEFNWLSHRSDLYTLTSIESAGRGANLFSPRDLCCGLYLNELLLRVLQREDPHPEIFMAYEKALLHFNQDNHEINLRIFEKQLLSALGYGLNFEGIQADWHYLFQASKGFIRLESGESRREESIGGKSLLALAEEDLQLTDLPKIKKIMRCALLPLVGDKPFKTRELFQ